MLARSGARSRPAARPRTGLRPVAAIAVLVASGLGPHCMHEQTFECELAVAKLRSCCAGLEVDAEACEFTSGCSSTDPFLSLEEATCIDDLSCNEVAAAGGCSDVTSLPCFDP